MKILFVNSTPAQCGVFQYGENLREVMRHSPAMSIVAPVLDSEKSMREVVEEHKPDGIVYNWHPGVQGWIQHAPFPDLPPQVLVFHEPCPRLDLFDGVLFSDPTLMRHGFWHPIGRPLYTPPNMNFGKPIGGKVVVGVHGFSGAQATNALTLALESFEAVHFRIHSPQATFGDLDAAARTSIESQCKAMLRPSDSIELSHDYKTWPQLLRWLSENHLNCYIRDISYIWNGLSSATDAALCARRPFAINHSSGFRHLWGCQPSICVEDRELAEILRSGLTPLIPKYQEWEPKRVADGIALELQAIL